MHFKEICRVYEIVLDEETPLDSGAIVAAINALKKFKGASMNSVTFNKIQINCDETVTPYNVMDEVMERLMELGYK